LTKSQPKTLEKTGLPIHWITELFKLFQARYLAKWSTPISGIEDRAVKEWAIGLDGITNAQLKYGVDSWDNDWPPTLPEFRRMCIGGYDDDDWRHKGKAYTGGAMIALPIKRAQKSIAIAEMKKIMKKLS